ncbi:hypothetical protein ROZALSC1DRAFT_27678, partial [Rozella allomycis CSF55]
FPKRHTHQMGIFLRDFLNNEALEENQTSRFKKACQKWKEMNALEKENYQKRMELMQEQRRYEMRCYKDRCQRSANTKKASFILNLILSKRKVPLETAQKAVLYGKELPTPPKSTLFYFSLAMSKFPKGLTIGEMSAIASAEKKYDKPGSFMCNLEYGSPQIRSIEKQTNKIQYSYLDFGEDWACGGSLTDV